MKRVRVRVHVRERVRVRVHNAYMRTQRVHKALEQYTWTCMRA